MRRKKNEIRNAVAYVLWKEELARKDDCYLILKTIQILEPDFIKANSTFIDIMMNAQSKAISFESITRVKRHFFKKHPEIEDPKARKARRKKEEEYREEYGHGGYTC